MPSCAINGPGHMPRPERRSHGCHSGCAERRLKAGSRRRRERDSVRLEPVIDVADPSAITLRPLDLQDSRSPRSSHRNRKTRRQPACARATSIPPIGDLQQHPRPAHADQCALPAPPYRDAGHSRAPPACDPWRPEIASNPRDSCSASVDERTNRVEQHGRGGEARPLPFIDRRNDHHAPARQRFQRCLRHGMGEQWRV